MDHQVSAAPNQATRTSMASARRVLQAEPADSPGSEGQPSPRVYMPLIEEDNSLQGARDLANNMRTPSPDASTSSGPKPLLKQMTSIFTPNVDNGGTQKTTMGSTKIKTVHDAASGVVFMDSYSSMNGTVPPKVLNYNATAVLETMAPWRALWSRTAFHGESARVHRSAPRAPCALTRALRTDT